MKFRLIIDSEPRKASENMAIDFALQKLCKVPVLRFYSWRPSAVSIGRFQRLKDEVSIEFCKKNNVDIVRRITGGGAVFHEHEITYSLCIPEKNPFISSDLSESYRQICNCVIKSISKLGLNSQYAPINDILVNGKKISGCAQTRKKGVILHHGTLLIDLDIEKMFKVLKIPEEKIRDKLISNAKERVTCLNFELNRKIDKKELIENLIKGFKESLGVEFEIDNLSRGEEELMKKIKKDIFEDGGWLYER